MFAFKTLRERKVPPPSRYASHLPRKRGEDKERVSHKSICPGRALVKALPCTQSAERFSFACFVAVKSRFASPLDRPKQVPPPDICAPRVQAGQGQRATCAAIAWMAMAQACLDAVKSALRLETRFCVTRKVTKTDRKRSWQGGYQRGIVTIVLTKVMSVSNHR